jgi:hypothetical protein
MPRKKAHRAGIAYCIVSANLWRGELKVEAIRICPSKEERDKVVDQQVASGGAYAATFPADIWMEEH